MRKLTFFFISFLFSSLLFAETRFTAEQYIEKYAEDAVKEMDRAGVPASITLAQGMLESGYGNSVLAKKANNHFGIKCHSDWTGPTYKMDDDKKNECFRKYKTVWHSYRDHSDFLKGKKRYASLFELKITDYKGWAHGLRKAGYATNKKYAHLLIDLIERYDLNSFVKGVKGKSRKEKKNKPNEKEEEEEIVETVPFSSVKISDNYVKYVVVSKGDTYYSISKRTGVPLKRIYKYNECTESTVLKEGTKVYLQPKRRKAKKKRYVAEAGVSVYEVSQMYGVKMKYLYKRNGWEPNHILTTGEVVLLRGRK